MVDYYDSVRYVQCAHRKFWNRLLVFVFIFCVFCLLAHGLWTFEVGEEDRKWGNESNGINYYYFGLFSFALSTLLVILFHVISVHSPIHTWWVHGGFIYIYIYVQHQPNGPIFTVSVLLCLLSTAHINKYSTFGIVTAISSLRLSFSISHSVSLSPNVLFLNLECHWFIIRMFYSFCFAFNFRRCHYH